MEEGPDSRFYSVWPIGNIIFYANAGHFLIRRYHFRNPDGPSILGVVHPLF